MNKNEASLKVGKLKDKEKGWNEEIRLCGMDKVSVESPWTVPRFLKCSREKISRSMWHKNASTHVGCCGFKTIVVKSNEVNFKDVNTFQFT